MLDDVIGGMKILISLQWFSGQITMCLRVVSENRRMATHGEVLFISRRWRTPLLHSDPSKKHNASRRAGNESYRGTEVGSSAEVADPGPHLQPVIRFRVLSLVKRQGLFWLK